MPIALERWQPWDYGNYVEMGRAVREGANPYASHRFYPLPTILWIFVPLSLAPDWFRFVWILFPFIFVLILFRLNGLFFLLFPPLWFVITDAMFDAWLLLPLVWLFQNRRTLAPIGAALVLFKPHITALAVVFMLIHWFVSRDWRALAVFFGFFAALWLPSFFVDPMWPLKMLAVLPERVDYVSILPLATTALSSWWSLGGIAVIIFAAMLIATVILFFRAMRNRSRRAQAFQVLQLIILPVVLASNLITVLPTLRERNEIIAVVLISLGAFMLDRALGGFGGGYAFIPLAALYFQTRARQSKGQET
ncbi:MAG: hypothetical protein KGJ80_11320 [Chloroflexota bacterium]|nr:hypothetical protein [Chloroflexota bacterium]